MIWSDEYSSIKDDYPRITSEFFPDHYSHPPGLKFKESEALYPEGELDA